VQAPEDEIRRLLDFAGVGLDERCLRFFEPGVATSASDTPVRRPLSDREAGAWRHYRELLAPGLPDPACEEYGHDRG
jgi:hypothetical protein